MAVTVNSFKRKLNNKPDPETCLRKTDFETGFYAQNLDRLIDRVSWETNFRQESVYGVLRWEIGTETGFEAGQGLSSLPCPD